jgi:hypothetical protein
MSKKFMMSPQGQRQIPCTEVTPKDQQKNASQSKIWSAITLSSALFKPGDKGTITITFGGYTCDGCGPDAAWSQIGKHSNDNYPSMNLGFIDPPYTSFTFNGVTYNPPANAERNYCGNGSTSCRSGWIPGATPIHEFGHALGMLHEHQNNLENSNLIKLNKDAVISYYNKIGMGESGAVTNVLDMYNCTPGVDCDYAGTRFDPDSIMLYALPNDWVIGTNPTKPNFRLSSQDIGWLQQKYPKSSTDQPELTVKFIDRNPEPWKVAWIQKIITETYGPILGVKWIFDTDSILKSGNTGTLAPTISNNPTNKSKDISPNIFLTLGIKTDPDGHVIGTNLNPSEYLAAIIVPTIIVFILLVIFAIWFYNRNKK